MLMTPMLEKSFNDWLLSFRNRMSPDHRSYVEYIRFSTEVMAARSAEFLSHMQSRRTIRHFSNEPVDSAIVDQCLQVASLAPNGANRQPWTFVVVENPEIRKQIRDAAETEEREFYSTRAPDEWLDALAPLGTAHSKPDEIPKWHSRSAEERASFPNLGGRLSRFRMQNSSHYKASIRRSCDSTLAETQCKTIALNCSIDEESFSGVKLIGYNFEIAVSTG